MWHHYNSNCVFLKERFVFVCMLRNLAAASINILYPKKNEQNKNICKTDYISGDVTKTQCNALHSQYIIGRVFLFCFYHVTTAVETMYAGISISPNKEEVEIRVYCKGVFTK